MGVSNYGEPSLMLVIQRRIEEFAEQSIYHPAERGNIVAMEELFIMRIALPNDVADLNGATALHVSDPRLEFKGSS